jgi:hypothetical protein
LPAMALPQVVLQLPNLLSRAFPNPRSNSTTLHSRHVLGGELFYPHRCLAVWDGAVTLGLLTYLYGKKRRQKIRSDGN